MNGDASPGCDESELEPARGGADRVEPRGRRQLRRRAERALQVRGGRLRLLDPRRALGEPDLHELRAQLVEITGEGGVRGYLAQCRDRDGVAHERPIA